MNHIKRFRLSYAVPYYAQIASPDLATRIFVEGLDPALDPRWAETGAETPQEYAYWVERACGIACLKMCVEALGGSKRPLMEWIRQALAIGGYLIGEDANGERREIGWVHQSLAELIQREGFYARPRQVLIDQMPAYIREGMMIIASVSYEVGDALPVTKKGGHLVVVIGADCWDGEVEALMIHNPSGRRTELQANALIPAARFAQGYTQRAIVVGKTAPDVMN
ncbi:MAG: hypothetical protein HPY45_09035 [Anaerolineae bacterium]|nr:hypothetical protein [Anaerolineae bacterium]